MCCETGTAASIPAASPGPKAAAAAAAAGCKPEYTAASIPAASPGSKAAAAAGGGGGKPEYTAASIPAASPGPKVSSLPQSERVAAVPGRHRRAAGLPGVFCQGRHGPLGSAGSTDGDDARARMLQWPNDLMLRQAATEPGFGGESVHQGAIFSEA